MTRQPTEVSVTVGPSFFGLLTLLFVALKLLGKVTWPWVWVLAPAWIPLLIGLIITIFVFILIGNEDRK